MFSFVVCVARSVARAMIVQLIVDHIHCARNGLKKRHNVMLLTLLTLGAHKFNLAAHFTHFGQKSASTLAPNIAAKFTVVLRSVRNWYGRGVLMHSTGTVAQSPLSTNLTSQPCFRKFIEPAMKTRKPLFEDRKCITFLTGKLSASSASKQQAGRAWFCSCRIAYCTVYRYTIGPILSIRIRVFNCAISYRVYQRHFCRC